MMSTLLERRLKKPEPDISAVTINSCQLSTLAREASNNLMGLITWLAPKTDDRVTLEEGIEDAVALVRTEFSLKGFTVVNQVGDMHVKLPRSFTRTVSMAALIALTDTAQAPANVVLASQFVDGELVLTISVEPVPGEPQPGSDVSYRRIEWEDVQALAEVESVRITYTADCVELRCPVSLATV